MFGVISQSLCGRTGIGYNNIDDKTVSAFKYSTLFHSSKKPKMLITVLTKWALGRPYDSVQNNCYSLVPYTDLACKFRLSALRINLRRH